MICKACGAKNADTDKYCRRCGVRLAEEKPEAEAASKQEPVSKKTVRIDKHDLGAQSLGFRIHECGYPLLPEMTVCPRCQRPISEPESDVAEEVPAPPVSKKTQVIDLRAAKATTILSKSDLRSLKPGDAIEQPLPKTVMVKRDEIPSKQDVPQAPVDKRTINPYLRKNNAVAPKSANACSLQPIARFEEDAVPNKTNFDAQTVVLNRQNTDPTNPSITSRQQARLTFENGVWYIEDLSDLKTTFVRVARKTALQDGDIILMGDREFKFSTQK